MTQFKTALEFHDIIKEKEATIEILEDKIGELEKKLTEIKEVLQQIYYHDEKGQPMFVLGSAHLLEQIRKILEEVDAK